MRSDEPTLASPLAMIKPDMALVRNVDSHPKKCRVIFFKGACSPGQAEGFRCPPGECARTDSDRGRDVPFGTAVAPTVPRGGNAHESSSQRHHIERPCARPARVGMRLLRLARARCDLLRVSVILLCECGASRAEHLCTAIDCRRRWSDRAAGLGRTVEQPRSVIDSVRRHWRGLRRTHVMHSCTTGHRAARRWCTGSA